MTSKKNKLLNELPQSGDNWYFAVRKLRAWIDDKDQGVYRPFVILTINLRDGRILDYYLVKEITKENVQETLVSAMMAAKGTFDSNPQRPAQVHFNDREILDALLPLLQDIGVRGRYLPGNEIVNEIARMLEEELRNGLPELPGLLSMRKVSPKNAGDFYEAAAGFYQSAPWVFLEDRDIISIQVPPQQKPYYVSVMGQAGVEYGLALYKTWEDVELMFSAYDSIDEIIPADGSHTLLFGEISGVPFDDIDAIERYGWEVAGPQAYPIPWVFTLDKDIKRPGRDELLWYQAALQAVPIFVSNHLKFDEENNPIPAEAEIPVCITSGSLVVKIKYPAGVLFDAGRQALIYDAYEDEIEYKLPFDRRALEGDLARALDSEFSFDFETELGKAQDILYQAWDESNPAKRIILAHQALAISPDCADAYVLLAEDEADSVQTALEYYKKGIKAGERALGEQFFEENSGYFWGILETRPYMRALNGYANCSWLLDEKEETVRVYEEMLRLNPGDNQGIRYELLDCLLNLNRDERLDELLDQYEGDASASWKYTCALVAFRKQGGTDTARAVLDNALEYNPFVPDYLLGRKRIPKHLPETIGFGNENEAVDYAATHLNYWRRTPGAVEWVKRNAETWDKG